MTVARRILVLLALLSLGSALAQTPAPSSSAESSAEKAGETRTIAIGDLARRMVDESDFIQRVVQRSATVVKTGALDRELDEISDNVDALGAKMQGVDVRVKVADQSEVILEGAETSSERGALLCA